MGGGNSSARSGRFDLAMAVLFATVFFVLPNLRLSRQIEEWTQMAAAGFALVYLIPIGATWKRRGLFAASRAFAAIGGAVMLGLYHFPFVAYLFGAPLLLESRAPERAMAAVVLGGGVLSDSTPTLSSTLRTVRAAQLYHSGEAPLLLFSSGTHGGTLSEARVMARLARTLDVPGKAILLEERSRNTAENARYSAQILQARGIDRILLVTDPLHLRRGRYTFSRNGIRVVPAPSMKAERFFKTVGGWTYFQMSLHEYLGLLYYRFTLPRTP